MGFQLHTGSLGHTVSEKNGTERSPLPLFFLFDQREFSTIGPRQLYPVLLPCDVHISVEAGSLGAGGRPLSDGAMHALFLERTRYLAAIHRGTVFIGTTTYAKSRRASRVRRLALAPALDAERAALPLESL